MSLEFCSNLNDSMRSGSKHFMFLGYSFLSYFSLPTVVLLFPMLPCFICSSCLNYSKQNKPTLVAHVYTRALMHMLISTKLDIHTIPQFQFLSSFNCVLYRKLLRYSVETGPLSNLSNLVVILLFLVTNTTCGF